jgi:hypothetical protein
MTPDNNTKKAIAEVRLKEIENGIYNATLMGNAYAECGLLEQAKANAEEVMKLTKLKTFLEKTIAEL